MDHLHDITQDTDFHDIEQMSQALRAQFASLGKLQQTASGMAVNVPENDAGEGDPIPFDIIDVELDEEEAANNAGNVLIAAPTSIEIPATSWPIPLPSNSHTLRIRYRAVEIVVRRGQALRHVSALRQLIAEKSFQFSHVIRVAPRKGIVTRARAEIHKINVRISLHCRAYNKCRAALVRLEPGAEVLSTFPLLKKDDVNATTALLDPNQPGSTTRRLSWIWQSGPREDSASAHAVRECTPNLQSRVLVLSHILCLQFKGYIIYTRAQEPRAGVKRLYLFGMKCSGRFVFTFSTRIYGMPGVYQRLHRVPLPMQPVNRQHGRHLPTMPTLHLHK